MKIKSPSLTFAIILSLLWKRKLLITLILLISYIFYLFIAETPTGINPTELPHFQPIQQLKDIPNLDLDRLKNARYIQFPKNAIEDVAVDRQGNIYAIAGEGPSTIYKVSSSNTSIMTSLGETGGRVLGTALNKQQTLLAFIDQKQGLKILNLETLQIKQIAKGHNGDRFTSLNSVAFSNNPDLIYFTHSCDFSMLEYHNELLYKTGVGKVYSMDIRTGVMKILVKNLQFPNGIVFRQQDQSLYVNQIGMYRTIRIPLQNNNHGKYSVVIDNLIGYPDNLKITEDGKLWIAFASLRDKGNIFLDNSLPMRRALINAKVSEKFMITFANLSYSGGVKVDAETGKIIDYFFGKPDRIKFVTGILEKNKKIYMASLKSNLIAVADYL